MGVSKAIGPWPHTGQRWERAVEARRRLVRGSEKPGRRFRAARRFACLVHTLGVPELSAFGKGRGWLCAGGENAGWVGQAVRLIGAGGADPTLCVRFLLGSLAPMAGDCFAVSMNGCVSIRCSIGQADRDFADHRCASLPRRRKLSFSCTAPAAFLTSSGWSGVGPIAERT